ncbi:hypothetical protein TNCV_2941451 [Trichonephila clavipes]|nr:hypothetical protein TNCV_2941451 [Trichonephila clavipes]
MSIEKPNQPFVYSSDSENSPRTNYTVHGLQFIVGFLHICSQTNLMKLVKSIFLSRNEIAQCMEIKIDFAATAYILPSLP